MAPVPSLFEMCMLQHFTEPKERKKESSFPQENRVYNTIQCSAVQCSAVQYSTVEFNTIDVCVIDLATDKVTKAMTHQLVFLVFSINKDKK